MRTETKTYNVYKFDELSDRAKERAHSDYLNSGDCWLWSGEAEATIEEIEKLFHIKLKNWSIGSYRSEYPDIHFDADWWTDCDYNLNYFDRTELKGNRARAFLWNNFGHVLLEPRTKYFCHVNGKRIEAVGVDSVKRKSRVFFTRVYEGTCPLTGVCFDCDALDPLAYFCFGVRWDDMEMKRVMTKDRTIAHDNRTTVEDVIRDCVYSMFKSFNDDVEEAESMKHFADMCEGSGWEFTEDGKML